ncbi:MAG: hypothetical protein HYX61_00510 [Gammaproteobacteria bacterium]|nr:hypothetical protein [Gammaproteobacteria bacterium]
MIFLNFNCYFKDDGEFYKKVPLLVRFGGAFHPKLTRLANLTENLAF